MNLAAENVEGAVYGAVVIGVLFAAEDARRAGYPQTFGAAVLILVLYWLTALYAHDLAVRLQRREQIDMRHIWSSCVHELTMVEGGLIPLLALLIAWAAGASVADGVTVAVWTTVVTIIALEIAAGWRARLAPKRLSLQAFVGVAIGLAIIALKVILH